jgi:hypothetical protein
MKMDNDKTKNILDDLYKFLGRFIVYPNEHAHVMHTLWIAHTHLIEAFDTTPRLLIVSAEKGSGKTRLLEITKLLVRNPLASMNMSYSTMYTAIDNAIKEKQPTPTVLLDEIDRLFEKRDTSDMTALLNAGWQRGQQVARTLYDKGKRSVEKFEVFCPVLMCGIDKGRIPDTVLDRSIVIRMKKRSPSETVEPFRARDNGPEAHALRDQLTAWGSTLKEKASQYRPELPKEIVDRNADKFEPLITVADLSDYGVPHVLHVPN